MAASKSHIPRYGCDLFELVSQDMSNLVFCVELWMCNKLSSAWYIEHALPQLSAEVQAALLPHATRPPFQTGARRGDSAYQVSIEIISLFAQLVARLWQCLLYSEQLFALAEQNNYSIKLENLLSAVTDALVFLESHGFGMLLYQVFSFLEFSSLLNLFPTSIYLISMYSTSLIKMNFIHYFFFYPKVTLLQ